MERKVFHARRGNWRIEVTEDSSGAHIVAVGLVPKDVKKSVELKENSGLKNSFGGLCLLASMLTA